MRNGETLRDGGDIPEESHRISRKTYTQRMLSQSSRLDSGMSQELNRSSYEGLEAGPSTVTFGTSGVAGGDSFEALPMSMSLLQTKMMAKDLDPFEGSRKKGANMNSTT